MRGRLWRGDGFLRLWAGQTVSLVGSQVSALAVPLTAVLVLAATPFEMGVLGAAQQAPWLVLGWSPAPSSTGSAGARS